MTTISYSCRGPRSGRAWHGSSLYSPTRNDWSEDQIDLSDLTGKGALRGMGRIRGAFDRAVNRSIRCLAERKCAIAH